MWGRFYHEKCKSLFPPLSGVDGDFEKIPILEVEGQHEWDLPRLPALTPCHGQKVCLEIRPVCRRLFWGQQPQQWQLLPELALVGRQKKRKLLRAAETTTRAFILVDHVWKFGLMDLRKKQNDDSSEGGFWVTTRQWIYHRYRSIFIRIICDITENMWCHLTATVGRWFPPFLPTTN